MYEVHQKHSNLILRMFSTNKFRETQRDALKPTVQLHNCEDR